MIADFQGAHRFLSNFYDAPVRYNGLTFNNSEAAFQAQKEQEHIEREKYTRMTASESKKAGKAALLRPDWNNVRIPVMIEIIHAKFTQNRELRKQLLATGDSVLVEGNTWNDQFWGVCRGAGENWLGRILMAERAFWVALVAKVTPELEVEIA